jgi:CO/xanthine dehydrogenase FAD-binding subunit
MKPPPFEYHAPTTIEEACEILNRDPDGSKVLAGGQSLVPLLNLRLARIDHLVDINRIDALDYVRVDDESVTIGARARQADVESSSEVRARLPVLAEALAHVSHAQIRNRGTVVGSVCHADPAAELPAVWLALGGEVTAQSADGSRTIGPDDFFTSFLTTTLEPNEIVTQIRFAAPSGATGASFHEVARRHGDFALVGVVSQVSLDGKSVDDARIAVFGAGGVPVRSHPAEQALVGADADTIGDDLLDEVAREVSSSVTPLDDIHASAEYRRHVAGVLARRAVVEAVERAARAEA